MRKSVTRGRISMPLNNYAKLFGTSQDQAQAIITEISDLGIGDADSEASGKITLTNRRLYREGKGGEAQPAPQSKQIEQLTEPTPRYISSSLSSNQVDKEEKKKNKSWSKPDVVRVFTYWQSVLDHPKAILTTGRETIIRARLKDGYSVESLEQAIDGCKRSAWHMGENPEGKVYDGLDLIFRSGEYVEKFQGYLRSRKAALIQIGKHNPEADPTYNCPTCFDIGEKTQPKPGGKAYETETIPCPDCIPAQDKAAA
jgi:hypothetical protein